MKPVIFTLIATICYAIANVLFDLKLSKYNILSTIICYISVILVVAILGRIFTKVDDASFDFPTGSALVAVIILGLIYVTADYFFVGAYTNGGSLVTVTSILTLVPVFASIIKFSINHTLPNRWQVVGYILASLAVLLVAKGSSISK
jgi:drug/metabolite transporter (DMT)-like permease